MAPTYKLTYFDLRGIAEPVRYMFAYKNVPYEDYRIPDPDWHEMKPQQPFGYIPVLEVDGQVLSGSLGIMRFVARELDLDGKNAMESAVADMAMESIQDCVDKLRTYARKTRNEQKQEKLKNAWLSEIAPAAMDGVEKILKKNGGKYVVGETLTWADFGIAAAVETVMSEMPYFREKYPLLSAHLDHIHSIPAIKAWIKKRPVTIL